MWHGDPFGRRGEAARRRDNAAAAGSTAAGRGTGRQDNLAHVTAGRHAPAQVPAGRHDPARLTAGGHDLARPPAATPPRRRRVGAYDAADRGRGGDASAASGERRAAGGDQAAAGVGDPPAAGVELRIDRLVVHNPPPLGILARGATGAAARLPRPSGLGLAEYLAARARQRGYPP